LPLSEPEPLTEPDQEPDGAAGHPSQGRMDHHRLDDTAPAAPAGRSELPEIRDDRDRLEPDDAVVLIVDDDPNFCRVLLDLAHQNGFKGIVALRGSEAPRLALQYRPAAVTLDIGLGDVSGWKVLDQLRAHPVTRDIPVHVVTVFDDAQERVEQQGPLTFLTKPASKDQLASLFGRIQTLTREGVSRVLVIEDDPVQRAHIVRQVTAQGLAVHEASSGQEALRIARREQVDCVILD